MPALDMVIDLTEHEVRCKEMLTGLMVPFGQAPSDVYGCPLISWTEPNKTSVEAIIILHDWWKKEDCKHPASKPLEGSSYTMEDALTYIDEVIAGLHDPSLTPLFKKESPCGPVEAPRSYKRFRIG